MIKNSSHRDIENRILKTVEIIDERGYNVTIKRLSEILIGGPIDMIILREIVKKSNDLDFDGNYVGLKGKIQTKKCSERASTNPKLKPFYLSIANIFIEEYLNFCPWIKCIMLTGSIATDGILEGDDIDLNIVVSDHSKYISWLIGILLSIKYSLKYRRIFHVPWFNLIKGVICICVIWEESQVFPFKRRDKQIAYEILLNSNVLYNEGFYQKILEKNQWLKDFFPQLYFKEPEKNKMNIKTRKYNHRFLHLFFEPLAKAIIFLSYRIYRGIIFWNQPLNNRIDHVLSKQYPYSILHKRDQ